MAALKQRELENARVTAEEMEKQMAPLRCASSFASHVQLARRTATKLSMTKTTSVVKSQCLHARLLQSMHCCFYRQSVSEFQKTSETKYASAETSAREWAEVTARANMHKGKWSEYWEQAKVAGDMGNEKVAPVLTPACSP